MILGILFWWGLILGGAYLALRAIRALEVGKVLPSELEALAEEIDKLREEHHQLGKQVTALVEGQDFMRELRGKVTNQGK